MLLCEPTAQTRQGLVCNGAFSKLFHFNSEIISAKTTARHPSAGQRTLGIYGTWKRNSFANQ